MRTTRNFVVGVVGWLFSSVEVKANASLYSHECHPYSHLSASYSNRIAQSTTSLALNKNRGWSLQSDKRKRLYLNRPPPRSFDRMTPTEKIVPGTFRVLADAIEDYVVGFCIGLTVGAIFELPKALLRPSSERAGNELGAGALLWARQTGEFMGSFRGCATAVRLVRSPKRDDWNLVYGCATAGAFMGRNQGPVGMATSALIWGAAIYLLEYKTDFRPISRNRENFFSPFRSTTRRSRL